MIDRRAFIELTSAGALGIAIGCTSPERDPDRDPGGGDGGGDGDGDSPVDAAPQGIDGGDIDPPCPTATYRDTYAQALYLDGSLGPLTGVIAAEYLIAGEPVLLDFWHGHGGQLHRFELGPAEYARLLAGERVTVQTTEVDGHSHMLFIDPTDPQYAVPGAEPVEIPACPD